jgi:hypothetical protein
MSPLQIKAVQMKPVLGLFWAKELKVLKIAHMGFEAGISLTYQLINSPHEELRGRLLEIH